MIIHLLHARLCAALSTRTNITTKFNDVVRVFFHCVHFFCCMTFCCHNKICCSIVGENIIVGDEPNRHSFFKLGVQFGLKLRYIYSRSCTHVYALLFVTYHVAWFVWFKHIEVALGMRIHQLCHCCRTTERPRVLTVGVHRARALRVRRVCRDRQTPPRHR
jgi:hypothetical protein